MPADEARRNHRQQYRKLSGFDAEVEREQRPHAVAGRQAELDQRPGNGGAVNETKACRKPEQSAVNHRHEIVEPREHHARCYPGFDHSRRRREQSRRRERKRQCVRQRERGCHDSGVGERDPEAGCGLPFLAATTHDRRQKEAAKKQHVIPPCPDVPDAGAEVLDEHGQAARPGRVVAQHALLRCEQAAVATAKVEIEEAPMQRVDVEQQLVAQAEADRLVRALSDQRKTCVAAVAVIGNLQTLDRQLAIVLIAAHRETAQRVIRDP